MKHRSPWQRGSALRAVCTLLSVSLFASCVREPIHVITHSHLGAAHITFDIPPGLTADDFTLEIDGQTQTIDAHAGSCHVPELAAGHHTVLVHNHPQGFHVAEGMAEVDRMEDTRTLSTLIAPLPGYLYSGIERLRVLAEDTVRLHIEVLQRVRHLRLLLKVTGGDAGRITSVAGTLAGIAAAFDLHNAVPHGNPVSTAPAFTRTGDNVVADIRLLGTRGEAQTLTLAVSFTDFPTQTLASDLTELLADFNSGDYTEPVTLTAELHMPEEAGIGSSISNWKMVEGEQVDIH